MKNNKIIKLSILLLFVAVTFVVSGCDLFSSRQATITLTQPFKTEYNVGDELDVTGGIITYTDVNGVSTTVTVTKSMISGFNSQTETGSNPRTMIITYNGATFSVGYTVSQNYADILNNQVYYAVVTDHAGYYYYLAKTDSTNMFVTGLPLGPGDFVLSEYTNSENNTGIFIPVTRSVSNNVVKYSGTKAVGTGSEQIVYALDVTLNSANEIQVTYKMNNSTIFNEQLTKYSGQTTQAISLQVGDVYNGSTGDSGRMLLTLTSNNKIKIYTGSAVSKSEFLQMSEQSAYLTINDFTSSIRLHKYEYEITRGGLGENTYLIIHISFGNNNKNVLSVTMYTYNSATSAQSNYQDFTLTIMD